jgi:hypothetical protein
MVADAEVDNRLTACFKRASAALNINRASHAAGPLLFMGAVIISHGTALPVIAAMGLWCSAELGSGVATIRLALEGKALEQRQKKSAHSPQPDQLPGT